MEILLIIFGIGALFIGHKIGVDNGRREVLQNINDRVFQGLSARSEFLSKFGVRGMLLELDSINQQHQHGIGVNIIPRIPFAVVRLEDLASKTRQPKLEEPDELASSPWHEVEADAPSRSEKLLQPSPVLAEIIGNTPVGLSQATRLVWDYIKNGSIDHGGRIECDEKLTALTGKSSCTLFEMTAHVRKNLS